MVTFSAKDNNDWLVTPPPDFIASGQISRTQKYKGIFWIFLTKTAGIPWVMGDGSCTITHLYLLNRQRKSAQIEAKNAKVR